jgi:hypothetical protein
VAENQQWAVTTAGVVLFGAFLTTLRNVEHVTTLDKFLAAVLLTLGVWAGWFYLPRSRVSFASCFCPARWVSGLSLRNFHRNRGSFGLTFAITHAP